MFLFINRHSLLISAITDTKLSIFFHLSANVTWNVVRKLILVEAVNFIKRFRYAGSQASAA
jgi:hypothetical protein